MGAPNLTIEVSPSTVHVGDVGTIYRATLANVELPADPLIADIVRLLFSLPGQIVLEKEAQIEAGAGSPVDSWVFSYQVQGDDGAGSPPEIFHAQEGPLRIQAYLEWSNTGSPSAEHFQFHSDVATVDSDGQELRIFPNVA